MGRLRRCSAHCIGGCAVPAAHVDSRPNRKLPENTEKRIAVRRPTRVRAKCCTKLRKARRTKCPPGFLSCAGKIARQGNKRRWKRCGECREGCGAAFARTRTALLKKFYKSRRPFVLCAAQAPIVRRLKRPLARFLPQQKRRRVLFGERSCKTAGEPVRRWARRPCSSKPGHKGKGQNTAMRRGENPDTLRAGVRKALKTAAVFTKSVPQPKKQPSVLVRRHTEADRAGRRLQRRPAERAGKPGRAHKARPPARCRRPCRYPIRLTAKLLCAAVKINRK